MSGLLVDVIVCWRPPLSNPAGRLILRLWSPPPPDAARKPTPPSAPPGGWSSPLASSWRACWSAWPSSVVWAPRDRWRRPPVRPLSSGMRQTFAMGPAHVMMVSRGGGGGGGGGGDDDDDGDDDDGDGDGDGYNDDIGHLGKKSLYNAHRRAQHTSQAAPSSPPRVPLPLTAYGPGSVAPCGPVQGPRRGQGPPQLRPRQGPAIGQAPGGRAHQRGRYRREITTEALRLSAQVTAGLGVCMFAFLEADYKDCVLKALQVGQG
jgi:hypothetical protein